MSSILRNDTDWFYFDQILLSTNSKIHVNFSLCDIELLLVNEKMLARKSDCTFPTNTIPSIGILQHYLLVLIQLHAMTILNISSDSVWLCLFWHYFKIFGHTLVRGWLQIQNLAAAIWFTLINCNFSFVPQNTQNLFYFNSRVHSAWWN